MNSPRYPPAGLLVRYRRRRVMIDGGPGAEPAGPLAAWLVSDERSELHAELRLPPGVGLPAAPPSGVRDMGTGALAVPRLGRRADLMFADAAG